jgi:hypothetical protein
MKENNKEESNAKEEFKKFLKFYYKYSRHFFINIYNSLFLYYKIFINLKRNKIPEINILVSIFPLERELRILIAFYTSIMFLSFFVHLPLQTGLASINLYSDIVAKFFTSGIGKDFLGIPYYSYFFEYPVIVGIITYISSAFAWLLYPPFPGQINPTGLFVYYLIQSLAIYVAGYIMVLDLYYFAKKLKIESYYILILLVLPSFVVYGIYNWDIIAIAFALRALRFYVEKRLLASAFCLSIAIATKVFPAILTLAIIREILYEKNSILKAIAYILVTASLVFLYYSPFVYFNPQVLYQQFQYHSTWYIEGSWLVIFYENPWKHNAQILTVLLALLFTFLTISYTTIKNYKTKEERLIETSFLLISSLIFSNYVHTPQMQLMILPLLLLQRIDKFLLLFIFDFLNSLVILTWFNFKEWGMLLFKYYPPDELGGPLNRLAVPTICAIFRDFLLLYFILYVMLRKSS